jgi:hypothetical protein
MAKGSELESLQVQDFCDSGVYPANYKMDTRGSFTGGTALWVEVDNSLPAGTMLKNVQINTSTPPTPSWRSAYIIKHRYKCTFTYPMNMHNIYNGNIFLANVEIAMPIEGQVCSLTCNQQRQWLLHKERIKITF